MTIETKFDLHETTITIATGYGWGLGRVGELASLLETTSSTSTATVEELAKALRYQIPRCAIFGFSPADMLAEISILFNAGIKLESVNLVMRALLANMESRLVTGRAATLLECSGDKFGDMMPLRQIMSVLRRQFRTMPQDSQIQAIATSFDKSLIKEFLVFLTYDYSNEPAVKPPVNQMSQEDLQAIEKKIHEATIQYLEIVAELVKDCGEDDLLDFFPTYHDSTWAGVELTTAYMTDETKQELIGRADFYKTKLAKYE